MSRARDLGELELLRNLRAKRASSADGKVCGNSACSEMGKIQVNENFYKRRGGKLDSWCIMCRRTRNSMWKFEHPRSERVAKVGRPKREGELNLGKAPWCKEHKSNSAKCGCAEGRFHKSPKARKAVSERMRGNTYALGNKGKTGPMSAAHKAKIGMAVRAASHRRKWGRSASSTSERGE